MDSSAGSGRTAMQSAEFPKSVKYSLAALVLLACAVVAAAVSDEPPSAPEPVLPESLQWVSPPGLPGLQAAWILGSAQAPGTYILRVRLAAGARIPPHTHPDSRHTTVLAGTLYVGFGEAFDDARLVTVPEGGVYLAPANLPHYLRAGDRDVVYQESGVGPTGNRFIPN